MSSDFIKNKVLDAVLDEEIAVETLFKAFKPNAKRTHRDRQKIKTEFLKLNLNDVPGEFPEFFLKYLRNETRWLVGTQAITRVTALCDSSNPQGPTWSQGPQSQKTFRVPSSTAQWDNNSRGSHSHPVPHNPLHRLNFGPNSHTHHANKGNPRLRATFTLGDFLVKGSSKKGKGKKAKLTGISSERADAGQNSQLNPLGAEKSGMSILALQKNKSNLKSSEPTLSLASGPVETSDLSSISKSDAKSVRKLKTLAKIYAFIMKENLCSNIMNEFYFIMTLIAQPDLEKENSNGALLSSARNCAQMAVLTLCEIKESILLLNAGTLDLLVGSPAISTFSQNLCKLLIETFNEKYTAACKEVILPPGGTVFFEPKTDTFHNFPSQFTFCGFRKQRDQFYRLFQLWEKYASVPRFRDKVMTIITTCENPHNLMRFSKLFRDQLLISCASSYNPLDYCEISGADQEKLPKSKPLFTDRPVPCPAFSGKEVFFKKFIAACRTSTCIIFFKLAFIDELTNLNSAECFTEENDTFVDVYTQKYFSERLTSTILLAKFLAFMDCPPYRIDKKTPEVVVEAYAKLELFLPILLDIESLLQEAIDNRRLVVTVPWLVSYLSTMSVSTRLTRFSNVWNILANIRKNIPPTVSPCGKLLLQLSIGWLFQVTPVPSVNPIDLPSPAKNGFDELHFVSESALYAACPYLTVLHSVLNNNPALIPRSSRPTIQADLRPDSQSRSMQGLMLKWEKCLLQNIAPDLRMGIFFLGTQIGSNWLKRIVKVMLNTAKESVRLATARVYGYMIRPTKKAEALEYAVKEWEEETENVRATVLRMCSTDIKFLLDSLAQDHNDFIREYLQGSCEKLCFEKINGWMRNHIINNPGKTKMKAILQAQLFSNVILPDKTEVEVINFLEDHNVPADTVDIVSTLRTVTWHAAHNSLDAKSLTTMLRGIEIIIKQKIDSTMEQHLLGMVFDLILFVYVRNIELLSYSSDIVDLLCKLHIRSYPKGPLSGLLSFRTLELIHTEHESLRLCNLFETLVKKRLLKIGDIKKQVTKCMELHLSENLELHLRVIVNYILDQIIDDETFEAGIKSSMRD